MVKGIRLQKPSPKLLAMAGAGAPLARAPRATMTTAMATKMKASGNHFSAQAVKRMPARDRALSSAAGRLDAPAWVSTSGSPGNEEMALGAHCPQLPTGLKMNPAGTQACSGIARECQVAASGFLEGSRLRCARSRMGDPFVAEISKFRDLDTRMAERRQASAKVRDLARRTGQDGFREALPVTPRLADRGHPELRPGAGRRPRHRLVPPLMACREQSARGFFAGDSFQACAGRGISASFQDFDRRIRRPCCARDSEDRPDEARGGGCRRGPSRDLGGFSEDVGTPLS